VELEIQRFTEEGLQYAPIGVLATIPVQFRNEHPRTTVEGTQKSFFMMETAWRTVKKVDNQTVQIICRGGDVAHV